jgi:16S rRNA (guanine966-N2)-methyltransferase
MMRIIAGEFRKAKISTPKGDATRPTQGRLREAVFNICQQEIVGANFLDICAGSGAMGLEALSRGAKFSTFIDNNRHAISAINDNVKNFKVENKTRVLFKDALSALKQLETEGVSFDLCYIDPPYNQKDLILELATFFDHSKSLLTRDATIFIENSEGAPLDGLVLNKLIFESKRQAGDSILYVFKSE